MMGPPSHATRIALAQSNRAIHFPLYPGYLTGHITKWSDSSGTRRCPCTRRPRPGPVLSACCTCTTHPQRTKERDLRCRLPSSATIALSRILCQTTAFVKPVVFLRQYAASLFPEPLPPCRCSPSPESGMRRQSSGGWSRQLSGTACHPGTHHIRLCPRRPKVACCLPMVPEYYSTTGMAVCQARHRFGSGLLQSRPRRTAMQDGCPLPRA